MFVLTYWHRKSALFMQSYIQITAQLPASHSKSTPALLPVTQTPGGTSELLLSATRVPSDDVFQGYLSEISDSNADLEDEDINSEHQEPVHHPHSNISALMFLSVSHAKRLGRSTTQALKH